MTDQEIIGLFSEALRDEHAAIVQFLQHGFTLADEVLRARYEGIARDEMRHFQWLSEAVVELGGQPEVRRGDVHLSAANLPALIRLDVVAEEEAMAMYERMLTHLTGQPRWEQLVRRILSDERTHHESFLAMLAESEVPGADGEDSAAAPGTQDAVLRALTHGREDSEAAASLGSLNPDIRDEYSSIVQYLHHAFLKDGQRIGRVFEQAAVDEMKHLGWLSEAVREDGVVPDLNQDSVYTGTDHATMLNQALAGEAKAQASYRHHLASLSDPALQEVLLRILDHEQFHHDQFSHEKARLSGGWTVGTLQRPADKDQR